MKMMSKTRLAAAVSATLCGLAMAPMTAQAQTAAPVASGLGQVLIFPYYTVNEGWQTLMNVTNVTDKAIAVKVRFHEAQNSRDVLDFNILLSPKDSWTGYVSANDKGGGTLRTDDKSCTSPILPADGLALNPLAYSGKFDDGGDQSVGRLTEGYVELIMMGECDQGHTCFTNKKGIGYLTEHVDGTPRDCKTADSYFVAEDPAWDGIAVPGSGNPIAAGEAAVPSNTLGYQAKVTEMAPLKGNLSLVHIATGISGGDTARYFEGLLTANMVTAQQFPWFLEPTIGTVPSGAVWNVQSLPTIEGMITHSNVANEWSSNQANGVKTDWVVNFPTKGFHVDQFCSQIQANNNRWRNDGTTALTCDSTVKNDYDTADGLRAVAPLLAPFENRWEDGVSQLTVEYTIYDREESTVVIETDGTTPSPAPPPDVKIASLPYETSVVNIGATGSALGSVIAQELDAPGLLDNGAVAGWVNLAFPSGLPVVGFMMKTRTFGEALANYGQMMDHAFPAAPPVK